MSRCIFPVIALNLGLMASVAIFASAPAAFAAIPPPDPKSSCANYEYSVEEKSNAGVPPSQIPEVVLGDVQNHLNTSTQLEMGRQVTVCIKGLYNWIYVQKNHASDLRLFIGGQILTSVAPSSLAPPGQEYVDFMLQPNSTDSPDWKNWAAVVDSSRHSSDHTVTISVAQGTQVFKSSAVTSVPSYPNYWYYIAGAIVFLLAALVFLAAKTSLLRYTAGAGPTGAQDAPFSLGLVQMAFWFFIAVAAYVYICVSTLQIHIPMGSVLGLLGISATTGLAAVAVDSQKSSTDQRQRDSLATQQIALKSRIADLQSIPIVPGSLQEHELMEKSSRLAQVNALLSQQPAPTGTPTSKGFLPDILNDGDGISFHRVQIAVWTIVLGCVFVWGVYRNMSMPEFDASLLTLMGISAGTYVGFKFPETPKT